MPSQEDRIGDRLKGLQDRLQPRIDELSKKYLKQEQPVYKPQAVQQPQVELPPPERPSHVETKSWGGFVDNLATDMSDLVKGGIAAVGGLGTAIRDIIPDVDMLPSILAGRDSAHLKKELNLIGRTLVNSFVDTYKDGIVEAGYRHPFTVFLDLTTAFDLAGGSVSVAAKMANRGAKANLKLQTKLIRASKDLSQDQKIAKLLALDGEAQKLAKLEDAGRQIRNAPYLPFTGMFQGAGKLLDGPLKETWAGGQYKKFRSGLMLDEHSKRANRIISSVLYAEGSAMDKESLTKILKGKLEYTDAEEEFFLDRLHDVDRTPEDLEKFKHVEEIIKGYKEFVDSGELMKSLNSYEASAVPGGFRIAKAKGMLEWQAEKEARKIVRELETAQGKKLSDIEKAGAVEAVFAQWKKEYTPDKIRAFAEANKARIDQKVIFHPFLKARDLDLAEWVGKLASPKRGELFRGFVGPLEKRKGFGVINYKPQDIMIRHVMATNKVKQVRKAVHQVLEDLKARNQIIPLERGASAPEGYKALKEDWLLGSYMDANNWMRANIAGEFDDIAKATTDPNLNPLDEAAFQTIVMRGGAADIIGMEKQREKLVQMLEKGKSGDGWVAVPDGVANVIQSHLAIPTMFEKFYNKVMSYWKGMALYAMPRYYLNNIIGNSIINLLSGSAFGSIKLADNKTRKLLYEATQNIWNENRGAVLPSWSKRVIHRGMDIFTEKFENDPRIALLLESIPDEIEKARVTNTLIAGKELYMNMDMWAEQIIQSNLKYLSTGQLVSEQGAHISKRIGVYKAANSQYTGWQERVDTHTGIDGTTSGRALRQLQENQVSEVTSFIDDVTAVDPAIGDQVAGIWSRGAGTVDGLLDDFDSALRQSQDPNMTAVGEIWRLRLEKMAEEWRIEKFFDDATRNPSMLPLLDEKVAKFDRLSRQLYARMATIADNYAVVKAGGGKVALSDESLSKLTVLLAQDADRLRTLPIYERAKMVRSEAEVYAKATASLNTEGLELSEIFIKNDPFTILAEQGKEVAELRKGQPLTKAEYEIYDNAVQTMEKWFGNYNSMHPLERRYMRMVFPFWTFTKTMFTLMFRMPGLRPKTVRLWSMFSKYFMDANQDDNLQGRYLGYIPIGGAQDGSIILMKIGSVMPFDSTGPAEMFGMKIPRFMDPANNPFIRVFVEARGGVDTFTEAPFVDKDEFITPTGQVMRYNFNKHELENVTPQKELVDSALSLLPHWRFLQEITNPNAHVPIMPDGSPRYDRSWIWAPSRLAGFPITTRNQKAITIRDQMLKKNILKKLLTASRKDPEQYKMIQAVWNDVVEFDERKELE